LVVNRARIGAERFLIYLSAPIIRSATKTGGEHELPGAMEDGLGRLPTAVWTAALACALANPPPGFTADPAQNFPDHPIKIIVGPSPDVFSRIVGERLQRDWGQAVIVEPALGASGEIAANAVQSAAPDGYTLLFASPTYTINTAMKTAPYELLKDFSPVALSGLISYALVVHPSVPARSVAELVAYVKANPGKLKCASAGISTVPHIACEYLNTIAGTNIVHVPFRDVNSAMAATAGNTTQMFFGVATNAKPQIESGALRGLAVSTPQRSLLLPDLPTMIESGYPTFDMPGWGGFLAPAGTPSVIVAKLNQEIQFALARPDVEQRLLVAGMEPSPAIDPANFGNFIKRDIGRWTQFVDAVGLEKLSSGSSAR
jgi:tripartite-type tricarboxylate transporter receptor subunit TctC